MTLINTVNISTGCTISVYTEVTTHQEFNLDKMALTCLLTCTTLLNPQIQSDMLYMYKFMYEIVGITRN